MTTSRKRSTLLSAALVFSAVPVLAGPADWDRAWLRQEWIGYEAASGYFGFPVGDVAIYGARHGLGIGTTAARMRFSGWDVPRRDGNDVSGHMLVAYFPLNVYVTLHSWHGAKKIFFGKGKRSIGRLEMYGSYSPWGRLGVFTRETRDIIGQRERRPVGGTAKAKVTDVGVRLDLGTQAAVSVGRLEFETEDEGLFRPKRFAKTYASLDYYFDFGITEGREAGGGVRYVFQDAWYWLSRPFRRRGIVETYD